MARVNEIRYVGYGVTDLQTERDFYRDVWKLQEVEEQDSMVYFATVGQDEHHVVRLRQAEVNHIDVIAMSAPDADAVDTLYGRVKDAGCRIIFEPKELKEPGGGYGFRFFSHDGLPFEVSSDVARRPVQEAGAREAAPHHISHVVLHSPDHRKFAQFLIDVLGFRLSDWIGDFMVFLRCNSAHHRVALLKGPPSLNHVAYDMGTVDLMMRGVGRLRQNGIDVKWGPGRHTAGDNTFSYFVTPNGFPVEYTSDLEQVDDDNHQDQVYAFGPKIVDQWGYANNGPQNMPRPEPDPCLFQPASV